MRQALELLRGVGRVDVKRMPAWDARLRVDGGIFDEAASYHAGLEEVTDAPTYETAAPVATPSQQPTISGRTDFSRPLLTVAPSATVVEARAAARVGAGRPVLAQSSWIWWESRSSRCRSIIRRCGGCDLRRLRDYCH